MQQLLYYGGDLQSRRNRVEEDFPPSDFSYYTLKGDDASLKISDVKDLQASLSLTAASSRLVLIEQAHSLTLPAQHALLKTLEEPPLATTIVLTLPSPSLLIPTILSRCRLIALPTLAAPTADPVALSLLKSAFPSPAGQRLQLARTLGNKRPEALAWLNLSIASVHGHLLAESSPRSLVLLADLADLLLKAHHELESNCNVQLTLENLFLSLPRTAKN